MKNIRFCENNLDYGSEEVKDRIENELEDFELEVLPCLGNCGECDSTYFAEVDDDIVSAEDKDELFEMIKQLLK